jgi:hypothetical protein
VVPYGITIFVEGAKKVKIVMRSLIVMLSLMMVSMVLGCDPEPKNGNGDEFEGKTINSEYQGSFKAVDIPNNVTLHFGNSSVTRTFESNTPNVFQAFSDGATIYIKNFDGQKEKAGHFEDINTFIGGNDGNTVTYKRN